MSSVAQLLDGAYSQLEEAWRRTGAPILEVLAPGLAEAEIDARARAAGVRLPEEAIAWWSRHDGVTIPREDRQDRRNATWVGPTYALWSLDEALAEYAKRLALIEEWPDQHPDRPAWDQNWFPFTINLAGDTLAVDCSVAPGDPPRSGASPTTTRTT